MPISPTYPGVYVEEVPSDVKTIVGVATARTAFVGRALRGPLNKPTNVKNFGDYQRHFGGLWLGSTMSYAVQHYFLNGGADAVIVRVASGTVDGTGALLARPSRLLLSTFAATATIEAADGGPEGNAISVEFAPSTVAANRKKKERFSLTIRRPGPDGAPMTIGPDLHPALRDLTVASLDALLDADAQDKYGIRLVPSLVPLEDLEGDGFHYATYGLSGGTSEGAARATFDLTRDDSNGDPVLVAKLEAIEPGEEGNGLAVTVGSPEVPSGETADPRAFRLTVKRGSVELLDAKNILPEGLAAALTPASELRLHASSPPIDGDATPKPLPPTEAAPDQPGADSAKARVEVHSRAVDPSGDITLEAADPGVWGDRLVATVTYAGQEPYDGDVPGSGTMFNLFIEEMDGRGKPARMESHLNLSVDAGHPRRFDKVLEESSELVRLAGALPADRPLPVERAPFDGGSDGPDIGDAELVGDELAKEGLYALEKEDLFNILCIPPPTRALDVAPSTWSFATKYCEKRRAILLVDPPLGMDTKAKAVAQLQGALSGLRHANVVFNFPRFEMADPLMENRAVPFVPCGVVAGLYARTDAARGVWKAPAGLEAKLAGVQRLTVNLTDPEHGDLNPLGLNCARTFPVIGTVMWGARTSQGADQLADQWKYLPVRRTALYIEESLYRGSHWAVFEPNDEDLWAQLRLNLGAFMHDLFRKGAFQGTSAKEAYFVKCDAETTPQTAIDQGIVNILVGFAPLKPAEFVMIKLSQITKKAGA